MYNFKNHPIIYKFENTHFDSALKRIIYVIQKPCTCVICHDPDLLAYIATLKVTIRCDIKRNFSYVYN